MSTTFLKYEVLQTDYYYDGACRTGYGIRVLSCCDCCEFCLFEFMNLFSDISKVEELINLFIRNNVSKVHIQELIEDYIG